MEKQRKTKTKRMRMREVIRGTKGMDGRGKLALAIRP
jgi:hypothetical protein